jgi:hypothetical protein
MFDKMKGMMDQMKMMQEMMKDENFKAFVSHPKVQQLFRDPEFKTVASSRDFSKIVSHPKFMAMAQDPEVSQLLLKIDPKRFLQA